MRKGVSPAENIRLLDDDDVREIHNNILHIMENIGLKLKNDEVLEFLGDNGCEVDFDEQMVYVPSYLVEECIDSAPSSFRLGARDSENDVMFQQGRSYFCSCSGPINVLDQEEGFKKPEYEDLEESIRVGDYLENLDVVWNQYTLVDDELLGLQSLKAMLTNTTKHIGVFNWYGRDLVGKQIEMLKEVVGSEERLRKRPPATLYVEPASPLSMAEEHAEAILEWTDYGMPVLNFPIPFAGATSPATIPGSVSQALAESFLGLVISQLNNPGNPFIGGTWPFPMDLRQGKSTYFAAEALLIQAVTGQMADFYGIPVFGTGGCTNSYFPDAQMGTEMAMTLMGAFYGGETLIHDIGYTGAGDAGAIENTIYGNEIVSILKRQAEGVTINDETLALEVMEDVGPLGEYVATKHTRDHMEDLYFPEFLTREKMEEEREPDKKAMKRVRRKCNDILETHNPEPVDEETEKKLDEIIDEASDLA
ncbi:MAG: Trimethylamine:corrinoid methyltransferase, MttB2 [Candidatus Methanohalarchaeum thermophilum]|uniref:Trimethylamine:corrinoid methyltransferase, MttB2 n=1 Tax=Methanohalarchaeum thermophilum TaxID=1903181 RepID=A0A1Q6DVL5_METT1|nr:MAG: Trimethylamine:corrinoid methyltransferase, MttB2 [Candidatus Methanohalarchaeum thermophilum]